MTPVWLALGSNLGDRVQTLDRALALLDSPALRLAARSLIVETRSAGLLSAPRYLNCAARFETSLLPLQLLRRCQATENLLGRRRLGPNSPRTIDIDIVFFGSARISTPALTIPHPRFHLRPFVLEPLRELTPLPALFWRFQ